MNGFTRVGAGTIDWERGRVGEVGVSKTELRLLRALVSRQGEVVSKATLLAEVWGLSADSPSRTLFSTMERLRKKLEVDPRHPRHLFTIGRDGYSFRPLPTRQGPRRSADLVGRGSELERIVEALDAGAIVTLKGPGGVGKSRLAREACPDFLVVELGLAREPVDVLEALAAALALPLATPSDPARELRRLVRVSSGGHAGWLLDGADHAVEALLVLLGDWPAPRPAVVITSRRVVGLQGEVVVEVRPLPVDEGVQLFLARASTRRPGWSPTAVELDAIRQLVETLDALPLALELAARWSGWVEPLELLARARSHRLPLMAGDDEERPSHHQDIEAVVRWSWDALPQRLQEALCAASLFFGGARVDDLERVLGDDALDRVDGLQVRSLVACVGGRVRVLDLVATFALARMAELPDEGGPLRRRHAACFARHGRDDAMAKLFLDGAAGFVRLVGDLGNLRVAVDHGEPDDAARAALAYAAVSRAFGSQAQVATTLEVALRRPITSPDLRARLWTALAVGRRYSGDPSGAFAALDEAATLAVDPATRAEVDKVLGTALAYHSSPERAVVVLERAREAFRQLGDAHGEAISLAELAGLEVQAGRSARGAEQLEVAVRLLRRVGARFAEAVYLGNLGVALMKSDRFEAAQAIYLQALALHRELGSLRFEAQILSNLGLLDTLSGRNASSIERYLQALESASRFGDRKDEAIAEGNLAWSYLVAGDLVSARRLLDRACDAFDELELTLQQGDASVSRAWLCRLEGDFAGCEAALDRADAQAARHGFGEIACAAKAQRGLLALASGDRDGAAAALAATEATARSLGLVIGWDGHRYLGELRDGLLGAPWQVKGGSGAAGG